jgi:hypothetical protein
VSVDCIFKLIMAASGKDLPLTGTLEA